MKDKKILKKESLKSIAVYTLIFSIIISFIIYICCIKYGKTFIFYPDAVKQHVPTLTYFRSLLVNFIRTGSLSTFTWNLGLGVDTFGNLAYYILGDFFSYFSILCPTKFLETFYCIMVIVRIYFIGLAFIAYARYKKFNVLSTVIGAVAYTFSGYALYATIRHPYYSNALILFPLVMIGIEKAIVDKKYIFYTLIITLLYISSFYFAYMISIAIAIYGITLIIKTYHKEGIKSILKNILVVGIYTLL